MRLAKKYRVPTQIALLYEFVNSLDLRSFIEQGTPHAAGDELRTRAQFEDWMRRRGLRARDQRVSTADHLRALELRQALRSFLKLPDTQRARVGRVKARVTNASAFYPLIVAVSTGGAVTLLPAPEASGLGRVMAELFALAEIGHLNRLKMCDSDECQWVFYDRSKPSNRRWCSTALCGNRYKTRAYRDRHRSGVS